MIVAFFIGFLLVGLAVLAAICDDADPDVASTRAYSEALDAVRRAAR